LDIHSCIGQLLQELAVHEYDKMDAGFKNIVTITNQMLPYHMWLKRSRRTDISMTSHLAVRHIFDEHFDGWDCKVCLLHFKSDTKKVLMNHLREIHSLDMDYSPLLSDPTSKKKENYKVA